MTWNIKPPSGDLPEYFYGFPSFSAIDPGLKTVRRALLRLHGEGKHNPDHPKTKEQQEVEFNRAVEICAVSAICWAIAVDDRARGKQIRTGYSRGESPNFVKALAFVSIALEPVFGVKKDFWGSLEKRFDIQRAEKGVQAATTLFPDVADAVDQDYRAFVAKLGRPAHVRPEPGPDSTRDPS